MNHAAIVSARAAQAAMHAPAPPDVDPQRFRQLMALWPTGVAVVSGFGTDGQPLGFVVGSLCSVSLEPMLLAFCIQKASTTWPQFRSRGKFSINFLAADQSDLCWRFASGDPTQRFAGLDFDLSDSGQPRLRRCCGWLDVALTQEIEAGDHWLALCEVTSLEAGANNLPLAFARGRLNRLEPCQAQAPDHFERWERSLNDFPFGI